MPSRSEAEEHLRVIRSLMEKSTIYRAISAPAAAIGGGLAIAASFALGNWWSPSVAPNAPEISGSAFLALWLSVLAVTASVNLFFLWREARQRGDRLISAGMKLALTALLPNYLVAACLTALFAKFSQPQFLVPVWIIGHGLALLATSHFAPRSLVWLGWMFLMSGLLLIIPTWSSPYLCSIHSEIDRLLLGQMWMALTFGLFHLLYAVCTWPRKRPGVEPVALP